MKRIITISREFASGGRTIGKEIAKILNYKYYDREIIDMTAKNSGFSPEFIEKNEQNISSSWLYNLLLGSGYSTTLRGVSGGQPTLPLADQVFNAQRKVILNIAEIEHCVIVGRCADFILRTSEKIKKEELLNVFIYADMDFKKNRAINELDIPEKNAEHVINQINKYRANHYNIFTESTWGSRENYDLLINSALLGTSGTAKLIASLAQ